MVLNSMRQAIVAAQLATRTEVDRLVSELARSRSSKGRMFWLPRIVQAWGIVPSPGADSETIPGVGLRHPRVGLIVAKPTKAASRIRVMCALPGKLDGLRRFPLPGSPGKA